MKKLGTKLVTNYKCDFCKRRYVIYKRGLEHEFKCYKNPDRHCLECDDTGLVDEVMNNGYMGTKNHDCYSCVNAKQAGGRSYLLIESKQDS